MKRWALASAAAVILLAGCSGGSGKSTSASTPSAPEAGATTSAVPSAAATPSAAPANPSGAAGPSGSSSPAPCPSGQPKGTYTLNEFAGQGGDSMAHGKGGDITVTFTGGRYTMTGKGDQPMTMSIKDQAAGELYVNGTIQGTYTKSGTTRKFAVTSSKGTARLAAGGQQSQLSFDQLTNTLGLDGDFVVACQGDRLAIAGTAALFSFNRA